MANDDKTEEATGDRLGEAREKGDVPKSREFVNFFLFFGSSLSFYFFSDHLLTRTIGVFRLFFDFKSIKLNDFEDYMHVLHQVMMEVIWLLAPLLSFVFCFGIAAHLAQFGLLFTTEKISPDFGKLNPIKGFAKFFSSDSLVDLIKSCFKILAVSTLFYLVLKGETDHLLALGSEPLGAIFIYFMKLATQTCFVMLLFMAVLGLGDLFYSKWHYAKSMRMTKQEVKDENKNREGDPLIKSRLRQMQRDRARKRMMDNVQLADLIVTNPTHVAVAIQYKKGFMIAPVVIAKGAGYIALRIKELAAEHNVPILERKQLARYLYRNVEVGEAIPESLYTAVAEILAYVYKMKKKFSQWRESYAGA